MRAVVLSLLRVTVAVAILASAGAAVIVQPVLGSHEFVGTDHAQPERLRGDVQTLTTAFRPRDADHPENLDAARRSSSSPTPRFSAIPITTPGMTRPSRSITCGWPASSTAFTAP